MATVLENRANTAEKEAELHNRLIKERYERLLKAEEDQLNESFLKAENENVVRGSATLAPERPVERPVEPPVERPTETPTFSHERIQSSLFTTETLDRQIAAEQRFAQEVAAPVVRTQVVEREKTENYVFSNTAKAVAAVFAAVVIVLLAIIGINSRVIENKRIKIRRLEDKRQELIEKEEDLQAQTDEMTSFEYVKQWAERNGFVFN